MKMTQLKKCIQALWDYSNVTPYIVGHTGIGKTQAPYQLAKELGYDGVINIRVGQMADSGDLTGIPCLTEFNPHKFEKMYARAIEDIKEGKLPEGADFQSTAKTTTEFATPYFLPREGKYILYFDELNRSTDEIKQSLFQIVLERCMNTYKLPENTRLLASGNPPTDDYEVNTFDAALTDRFCFLIQDFDYDEWFAYSKEAGMSNDFQDFLTFTKKSGSPVINYQVGLKDFGLQDFDIRANGRSTTEFAKLEMKAEADGGLDEMTLYYVCAGMLGEEVAKNYRAFKKENERLTGKELLQNWGKNAKKWENVCNDYNKTDEVATVLEQCFSYLGEVKNKPTVSEAKNFIKVIEKMPDDYIMTAAQRIYSEFCSFDGMEDGEQKISKNVVKHVFYSDKLEDVICDVKKRIKRNKKEKQVEL